MGHPRNLMKYVKTTDSRFDRRHHGGWSREPRDCRVVGHCTRRPPVSRAAARTPSIGQSTESLK